MNRLFHQSNPFENESWEVLRRRFRNEFDGKAEFDIDDPGSLVDVLVDHAVAISPVDTTESALSFLGAVWLAEAIQDTAPKVWVAGFNKPGYLPDNEPITFGSRTEAAQYVNEEFLRDRAAWDEADNETSPETPYNSQAIHNALMLAVEARHLKVGNEVSFSCNNVVYWIRRRSMTDAMNDPEYTSTL